jgi:photosystem II stability/assembly factor-like uncharacterized protein
MNYNFRKILLLILFCCGYISCSRNLPYTKEIPSTVIKEAEIPVNTYETQSTIVEKDNSFWNVKTVQIVKFGSLENVYFLDENVGITNSYAKFVTTFYKTTDSGKSWGKISSIKDFSVDGISFVSLTEGFLVASKLKPSSSPTENGSYIMKTEDGGQNWETVFSAVDISFYKIAFNSDGMGLAVGRKSTPTKYDSSNFVLLTNDKGQTWTDVSDNLNKTAVKPNGRVEDSITNIAFSKDKGIVILSLRGKIYNSSDQGKSWSLISNIEDEPPQTGIYNFGILDDGRFWMSGGTVSIEGKWGMIAVMNNRLDWDRYRLNGYYFSDIEFLSNNEVIACGAVVAENNFGGASESDKAVILYSNDSGKAWKTIHESKTSSGFTSITKLSEHKLFISGNNGNEVFLERIQN